MTTEEVTDFVRRIAESLADQYGNKLSIESAIFSEDELQIIEDAEKGTREGLKVFHID